MKNLKLIFVTALLVLCSNAFSQLGITSYSIYSIGINTSQNKKITGELKVFTNQPLEDLNMEADGFYNFEPGKYHMFSMGLGVNFLPFKGFDNFYALTIPVSLQIFPLQDFKKLSLILKLLLRFYLKMVRT